MYDSSNHKVIKAAEKDAKQAEARELEYTKHVCSTTSGREWLWNLLEAAKVFSDGYDDHSGRMAYLSGQRGFGLRLLDMITTACPEQFTEMMREANVRRTASEQRAAKAAGQSAAGAAEGSEPSAAEAE